MKSELKYMVQRYIYGEWQTICFVSRKNSHLWSLAKKQWINDTPVYWRLVECRTNKVIEIKD